MPAVGTWRHVITASLLLLGLVLLILGMRVIRAQEDSQTERQPSPDHYYYQFFGYSADVTIDGEPLQVGDSITPILNGNAVTPAVVAENGFFLTFKHLYQEPPIGECKVVYEIHRQQHAQALMSEKFTYARGCGDIWVVFAIVTTSEGGVDGEGSRDQLESPASGGDEPTTSEPADSGGSASKPHGDPAERDTLEDDAEAPGIDSPAADGADNADDADNADNGGQMNEPETASEIQQPQAPRTGTGGVYVRETKANWPVVAGVLFLLVSAIGLVTVMVHRRTDQSMH